MFSGIVTDVGRVRTVTEAPGGGLRLEIGTAYDTATIALGASIACSGPCLTVVDKGPGWFAVDVSCETADRTTLGDWREGTGVNLERALALGDELGGHLVTGHIDGVAAVESCGTGGRIAPPHGPLPGGILALRGVQGLGHARRRLADGERGRRRRVRDQSDSPHAGPNHLPQLRRGPPAQP